jgi:hypothetical protein
MDGARGDVGDMLFARVIDFDVGILFTAAVVENFEANVTGG